MAAGGPCIINAADFSPTASQPTSLPNYVTQPSTDFQPSQLPQTSVPSGFPTFNPDLKALVVEEFNEVTSALQSNGYVCTRLDHAGVNSGQGNSIIQQIKSGVFKICLLYTSPSPRDS